MEENTWYKSKKELESEKEVMKERIGNGWKYRKRIREIKKDAKMHKKEEEKRLRKKLENIERMRKEKKEKILDICPDEIKEYKDAKVFDKKKFYDMVKEDVSIRVVGDIELSKEENEFLKLNPKFAVMERLMSETMEVETESAAAKYRYHIIKEDEVIDDDVIDDDDDENVKKKKRRRLNTEEEEMMKEIEVLDAEGRQVFDVITKTFDYSMKRSTDLNENAAVKLPQPSDPGTESSINVLKRRIMEVFRAYKMEKCDNKGKQKDNLTELN